jgi:sugar lactone lactonase YvrE
VGILFALFNLFDQVACATDGIEYVIVSQPRLASVVYIKVNVNENGAGNETYPLITAGLKYPLGIAVDNAHRRLYVADPDSGKVFWYNVIFANGGIATDGHQNVAASGGAFRWVTVDVMGTVFMTDEGASTIAKVTADQVRAMKTEAEVVYAGTSTSEVSGPAGIVADGSHLFWANKVEGKKKGCIVKGMEKTKENEASAAAVATNVDKVFGVCSSQNNIFYSDEAQFVYGVKKNGGDTATVVDILVKPRGCAWDGDGTVYVADKGGNAIWSFPSAMEVLGIAQSSKIFEMEDPFGVSIFVPPPPKPVSTGVEDTLAFLERNSSPRTHGLLAPLLLLVCAITGA